MWWWARILAAASLPAVLLHAQSTPPSESAETAAPSTKTDSPSAKADSPSVRLERPARPTGEGLQEAMREEAARLRVEKGRVHPRLHDIQRTATQTFIPKWSLVEDHPRKIGSVGSTMKAMGKSVLRSWMTLAPRFAKNDPPPLRPRHHSLERPGDEDDPTLLETYDELAHQSIDHANALAAEVCLDLAPGKEASAKIVRTSGRGRFDKMVRESALVAATARPYPSDAPAVRACYRFTAQFATMPPLPFLSCTWEKSDRTDSRCVYPLKRVIGKKVELISVE